MHHHRIDRGLLEQHDVAGEIARGLLLAHGMAAVFDHDGFLVVALHMRQRFERMRACVLRIDLLQIDLGALLIAAASMVGAVF